MGRRRDFNNSVPDCLSLPLYQYKFLLIFNRFHNVAIEPVVPVRQQRSIALRIFDTGPVKNRARLTEIDRDRRACSYSIITVDTIYGIPLK